MAIKPWNTSYPTSQDPDPIQTNQPDLDDESSPGAADGDVALSSQVEALRDKLHGVCKKVGDDSGLPIGSVLDDVTKLVDTQLPILVWIDAQSINVVPSLGSPTTTKITLQDGKQRSFTGTLAWTFTTGVGDLGLDTGTEQASSWYYLYLVPKSGDDDSLSCRASLSPPGIGPSGYSNFKYIGSFRNNASSNIIEQIQIDHNTFSYKYQVEGTASAGLGTGFITPRVDLDMSDVVPVTATLMQTETIISVNTPDAANSLIQELFVFGVTSPLWQTYIAAVDQYERNFASPAIPIVLDTGIPKIGYQSYRGGATLTINLQKVITLGWVDGYLSFSSSSTTNKAPVDTKLPTMTYIDVQTIYVAKSLGEPGTNRHTLQDNVQRTFTGTLAWTFTTGVGDLGLDTGTEQVDTWYYLYLVPSTGSDAILSVRASITDPSTGPTGYTNWKYIGAFYNDASSNIIVFKQIGDTFYYVTERTVLYSGGAGNIEPEAVYAEIILTNYIPATATKMDWFSYVDLFAETGASWTISWSIDSYSQYFGHACRSDPDGATSHGQTVFPIPVTTNRSIWRRRARGAGTNDIALIWYGVKSWTDGYLT